MVYKLSVIERLILLGLVPDNGDFLTLKIVRNLKGDLSFSETEMNDLSMKQTGERVIWNTKIPLEKEIEMGPKMVSIIIDKLDELEKGKKLSLDQLPLYERFVLPEKNKTPEKA